MKKISLTVNDAPVEALVEPRTHLADFLREHCNLTGTHLGCEHGVCGACTLLLDDAPVRSCITYAVACDGAAIRTVEGYDGDPLMARLRQAFTEEHALQCGFCTPGMLASAYDIVRRLGGASDAEIRTALSGNLCRCTGYMGITAAIKRVMAEAPAARAAPAPAAPSRVQGPAAAALPNPAAPAMPRQAAPALAAEASAPGGTRPGWTRIEESFTVPRPPAETWQLLADIPAMVACMPGATLESQEGGSLRGRFRVKLGPISASFAGTAELTRDDAQQVGQLTGGGRDAQSASQANGNVAYRLSPLDGGRATRVDVTLDFRLQGMLAQFGRAGLVRDLIARVTGDFARNLAALGTPGAAPAGERPAATLNAGALLGTVLWRRLQRLVAAVLGRGER